MVRVHRTPRHVGALRMQLQKTIQCPADFNGIARHDELEGVSVAAQRVVAVTQRLAQVASQGGAKLRPRRGEIEHIVVQSLVPLRCGLERQGAREWRADSAPLNPVPAGHTRQPLVQRAHCRALVARLDQRAADLGERRIGAHQPERSNPQRTELPSGEDQRHDRDTCARHVPQHAEQWLLVCARAAIQQMLAPGKMPLLPGKGQRVPGDLIETLVVGCERANALDIGDDVRDHRAGEDRSRSRWLNRSTRAAYASLPRSRGSRCFGLGHWALHAAPST